jgi:hypothetical protein
MEFLTLFINYKRKKILKIEIHRIDSFFSLNLSRSQSLWLRSLHGQNGQKHIGLDHTCGLKVERFSIYSSCIISHVPKASGLGHYTGKIVKKHIGLDHTCGLDYYDIEIFGIFRNIVKTPVNC